MNKEVYDIGGISCSSCVNAVEKKIKSLDGIKNVSVNLVNRKIYLEYNSSIIDIKDIKSAVESIGYKILKGKSENKKFKMILIFIVTILVVYMSLSEMFGNLKVYLPKIVNPVYNLENYLFLLLFLTLIVIFLCINIFKSGLKALFKSPNMYSLISIGSLSALLYSIYQTIMMTLGNMKFEGHLYYESVVVILCFVSLGKYLEERSVKKTNKNIEELINLFPEYAIVLKGDKQEEVKIEDLKVGDICLVLTGSKVPIDGMVLEGEAYINESHITGESVPVFKKVKDKVIGGSINESGIIEIKVTSHLQDSMVSKIVKLIEESTVKKVPIASLADKISSYFVPTIFLVALASFIIWYFVSGFETAFSIFVSTLVIACPCALGLATPIAIVVGTGLAAKNRILIKDSESLEKIGKCDTIVLDKTGTITIGKPKLLKIHNFGMESLELNKYIYSLEKYANHPIAKTVNEYLDGTQIYKVSNYENVLSLGIKGNVNGKEVLIGNKKLLEEYQVSIDEKVNESNDNLIYVSIDNKLRGILVIRDTVKSTSRKAIRDFVNDGYNVVMLTGDSKKTAKNIADELGIKEYVAEIKPDEKYDFIRALHKQNKKVIMVGDGINDSVALTEAEVGIAIGSSTDIAIESSDIILLKDNLNDVIKSIRIGKITIKNIKQNLFWAFIYNIVGILFSTGVIYAFGGPMLNPIISSFIMMFSSLSVVFNSLRINYKKI